MLLEKKHLIRGQQILTHFGYYSGSIDGVWGPASIEAKKKFEVSGKFAPGIPNNGLPFKAEPPYARGIFMNKGMMSLVGVNDSDLPSPDQPKPEAGPEQPDQKPAAAQPNHQINNGNNRNRKKNRNNGNHNNGNRNNGNQQSSGQSDAPTLGDLNIKAETMGEG
jgi:hypothetical protein